MQVLIYAKTGWPSGRILARSLNAAGVAARRTRVWPTCLRHWQHPTLIVSWGGRLSAPAGSVLNGSPVADKREELRRLAEAGVPVPEVTDADLPEAERALWLGRSRNHYAGLDLLRGVRHPSFYVRRLNLVDEFRVHVFDGKCICVGRKVPSDEPSAYRSDWIRSRVAGWRIAFDDEARAAAEGRAIRTRSKAAVAALGYNFGAVDVGVEDTGRTVVLEVNSAPGLSDYTAAKYAEAIRCRLIGGPHP